MIWTILILSAIVGSFIGAILIRTIGRKLSDAETVRFWNSYMVCLIATLLVYTLWYVAGETFADRMVGRIVRGKSEYIMMGALFHILVSFTIYTLIGKVIWRSSWLEVIKAHITWIGINAAILIGFFLFVAKELNLH